MQVHRIAGERRLEAEIWTLHMSLPHFMKMIREHSLYGIAQSYDDPEVTIVIARALNG
jgi:hypothetical protein